MPQGRGKKSSRKPTKQSDPNLVVVTVTNTAEGRSIDVGTTGNIKLTEAPTLLRLAANIAEDNLGLSR